MCVTSGPGVPTGGSLPHATASSSTFLRRRTLRPAVNCTVECDFRGQYPKPAGPISREDLATPPISQRARQDAKTPRIAEKELGECGGDWGDEMEKGR